MGLNDILYKICIPLISALLGAFIAFRFQYKIELRREKRYVLQNLMMYRNVGAHELEWIKILNAIDVIFINNEKVIVLYHTYLSQLAPSKFKNEQHLETLVLLIHEIAVSSGFKKLTLERIRDSYAPNALDFHYPSIRPPKDKDEPPSSTPSPNLGGDS